MKQCENKAWWFRGWAFASVASRLPNLSPQHAHTQELLLQSTHSRVPFFNSFLSVLFVQLRRKIPCGGA